MADVFTKKKRSEVMARIRSRGNKATELRLIELFRAWKTTGWRRSIALLGKPDFVFRRERVVIFVDGCFWHGCPEHGTMPTGNRSFWKAKLSRNAERDRLVSRLLRKAGWAVLRIWEHELTRRNETRLLRRIQITLERTVSTP